MVSGLVSGLVSALVSALMSGLKCYFRPYWFLPCHNICACIPWFSKQCQYVRFVQSGVHRSCRLETAVFPGFCGCFLFCSFSGVILYPESAWRSSPPSPPAPLAGTHSGAVRLHAPLPVPRLWTEGARRNTSPQTLADKVCRRVSKI